MKKYKYIYIGLMLGLIFASLGIGFIIGHEEGEKDIQKRISNANYKFYEYVLASTYGTHTIGVSSMDAESSKNMLNLRVEMAKHKHWSVIGYPRSKNLPNGGVAMYQQIMRLDMEDK